MRSRSRGFGLFDALIALAIVAFGMVAMSRFQARMVTSTTEAQTRTVAAAFADELLSSALVDNTNAACYTRPQAGVCGSANAIARTAAWADRAASALPGPVVSTSTLTPDQRLTVVITWAGRESQENRRLEATTDVR
jgi:type IV pilus assembly protein PilV